MLTDEAHYDRVWVEPLRISHRCMDETFSVESNEKRVLNSVVIINEKYETS